MLASAQSRTARQPPAHEILRSRLVNEFLTNFYRVVVDFLTASSQYRCSFIRRGHRRLIARRISLKIGGSVFFATAARPRSACREDAIRPKISPQRAGVRASRAHYGSANRRDYCRAYLGRPLRRRARRHFDLQDRIAGTVVGANRGDACRRSDGPLGSQLKVLPPMIFTGVRWDNFTNIPRRGSARRLRSSIGHWLSIRPPRRQSRRSAIAAIAKKAGLGARSP